MAHLKKFEPEGGEEVDSPHLAERGSMEERLDVRLVRGEYGAGGRLGQGRRR